MTTPAISAGFAPTGADQRIQTLDVLRGFALLGILLVNMETFSNPVQLFVVSVENPGWWNRAATWAVRFFVEAKFYSLFSLLFGIGFALQMDRAARQEVRFTSYYIRRLLILLAFGLVHAFLIWPGDILVLYALVGFALLLFRNAGQRTLIVSVILLLAIPAVLIALVVAIIDAASLFPGVAGQIQSAIQQENAGYVADLQRGYDVYANGSFPEITAQRAHDWLLLAIGSVFFSPNVFAMFLLGVWFARRRAFGDVHGNISLFRKLIVGGLILGIIGNGLHACLIDASSSDQPPDWTTFLAVAGLTYGAPALMLVYASVLTLLNEKTRWRPPLAPLACTGRIALTNYLGQSIICTFLFYGYGLGYFGKVDKAAGLAVALIIYTAQVAFSVWWLQHFRFGPAEWLWRSLTYLKLQPMRRARGET